MLRIKGCVMISYQKYFYKYTRVWTIIVAMEEVYLKCFSVHVHVFRGFSYIKKLMSCFYTDGHYPLDKVTIESVTK
jgi:hypothetical protein